MSPTTQTVEYIVRADAPANLEPDDPRTPALADVSKEDFVLFETVSSKRLNLGQVVLTSSLERSIDGASVVKVTCKDNDACELLQHPLLRRSSDGRFYARTVLDSLVFHLVGVRRPAARRVELEFEEQPYNALRRHDDPIAVSRGKYTRAQFIKRLCDEANVKLISPELNKKQPIAKQSEQAARKNTNREPGIAGHAKLTVKGQPISASQRKVAETLLDTARAEGAGELPTLALICAAIGESTMGDDPSTYQPNSAGYWGVLQGASGTHGTPRYWPDPHDVAGQAKSFLHGGKGFQAGGAIALSKIVKDPGEIATRVEASGEPGAFYGVYAKEAKAIIEAYTGGSNSVIGVLSNDADEYTVSYEFSRGENGQREDSITCIRRLADEVAWYFFVSAGKAYFVSGNYLLRSRARMLVEPGAEGVELVTFGVDESSKYQDTVTVQCRAARWQAPPGSVVDVSGYGPVDGRWLVANVKRPKLTSSNQTIVTLVHAKKKKPEPAHETRQRQDQTDTPNVGGIQLPETGSAGRVPGSKDGVPVSKLTGTGPQHETAGLPGYPAYDYFAPAGSPCVAPVDGTIIRFSGHDPASGPTNGVHGPFGYSIYLQGDNGNTYFLTHLGSRTCSVGDHVRQGQQIGTVGDYAKYGGANHIHMGVHQSAANAHPRT